MITMAPFVAILNFVQRRLRLRAERHPELAPGCARRIEAVERVKSTLSRRDAR